MDKIKKEMLEKNIWAVVGATPNEEKFGNKIYKKLKEYDYKVYPVNPNYDVIEGDRVYGDLKALPEKPDCINMVVPAKITNATLDVIKELGIKYVWLQPGTFDENTIDKAEAYNLKFVFFDCILVALDQ